ncbi:PAP2 superfamily [Chryseobacterium indoltheticum]|uniref:PAP2 superfamily n=1 Tax=Chryseobacterium indoltheticum TaxID=254 RepID=A0A381FIP5_9FLAO|nr:phosphatase PAP2 family protein [Chryseobacterium indoltheticum]SUX46022.1 PAP2 superfamily [Chryseobacterium indoltheticum]
MKEIRLLNFISKNKTVLYRWALIILPVIFVLLSAYVLLNPPQYLDIQISNEIQEHQTVNLNTIMIWISWLGRIPVSVSVVSLLSLFFDIIKKRQEALFILSSLLSGVIGLILKILINRPRPTDDLVILLEETKYQSFPSGHVLFYTMFFGSLAIIFWSWRKITLGIRSILAVICLSMIFIGAV